MEFLFKMLRSNTLLSKCLIIILILMVCILGIAVYRGGTISYRDFVIYGNTPLKEKEEVSKNFVDFQSLQRWEGTWYGTANDIPIKSEKSLDNEIHSKQRMRNKILISLDKNILEISGKIIIPFEEDGNKTELVGVLKGTSSKVKDDYATINYTIVGIDNQFETFGTSLLHLSGTGKTIDGHYLSKRIFGKGTRAFGTVKFERIEHL